MEVLQKLGIDWWSMLLYLVNTGLLLVLLTKLLYKPLLKIMDERRETVRKNLEETEHLKQSFAEQTSLREQEMKASMERLQAEVLAAKKQAEERVQVLMADAEKDRERLLEDARKQIKSEKDRLMKDLESDVRKRIEDTILFVLKNKLPSETVQKSVESAWKELYG